MKNMTFTLTLFAENSYCYYEGYQIKRGIPLNRYLADIIDENKKIIRLNDGWGNIYYSNDKNIVKMVEGMREGSIKSKCTDKLGH